MNVKTIEIEPIIQAIDIIKEINKLKLDPNTCFTYQGNDLLVDEDLIEDFRYTGLSLSSFIDIVLRSRV